jgi:hypothetical protein
MMEVDFEVGYSAPLLRVFAGDRRAGFLFRGELFVTLAWCFVVEALTTRERDLRHDIRPCSRDFRKHLPRRMIKRCKLPLPFVLNVFEDVFLRQAARGG